MQSQPHEYSHEGVTFRGELAQGERGPALRPGVLVVHEGLGISEHAKRRARELAELGYIAFACDMFGGGRVAKDLAEGRPLMLALRSDLDNLRGRVRAGLAVLAAQPGVDPTRLAAIGFCFGGLCALELARSGADLAAVVSFHGVLRTERLARAGEVKAKVLVCHGAADPVVSSEEALAFQKEMTEAGVDWHMLTLGGAGHGFMNPDSNRFGVPGVAHDPNAERRAWAAMRSFFDSELGAP